MVTARETAEAQGTGPMRPRRHGLTRTGHKPKPRWPGLQPNGVPTPQGRERDGIPRPGLTLLRRAATRR